jgi:hypothetical protein
MAADRLGGLELDRHRLAGAELRIDMGHHAAGGDVADQAELAPAVDDQRSDAQYLDQSFVAAPLGW